MSSLPSSKPTSENPTAGWEPWQPASVTPGRQAPLSYYVGVLALLLGGLVLRYRFAVALNPPSEHVFSDMAGFVRRAQHFIDGQFPPSDTLFPPGEHLLLALSGLLLGGYDTIAVWVHLIAGVAVCYWVARAAEHHVGRGGALTTLLLCVIHFPFIALGGYYLAETVFAALLALLFLLMSAAPFPWTLRRSAAVGAVAALGLVWKGNNVFLLPILALWTVGWWVQAEAKDAGQARRCWLGILVGFFTIIGAQTLYFFHYYERPLPIAAGGAYNFVLNKCPGALIVGKDGMRFQSPTTYYTSRQGVQRWDVHLYDQRALWKGGFACVGRDPWVVVASLREILYLFTANELWPVNTGPFETFSARYQRRFALLLFPGILLGLLALAHKPFATDRPPFLLVLSVCAAAWVFMGEMRFRIPFDVAFIPLGVVGWKRGLAGWLGNRVEMYVDTGLAVAGMLLLGLPVTVKLFC
jgi:hypothetical protein